MKWPQHPSSVACVCVFPIFVRSSPCLDRITFSFNLEAKVNVEVPSFFQQQLCFTQGLAGSLILAVEMLRINWGPPPKPRVPCFAESLKRATGDTWESGNMFNQLWEFCTEKTHKRPSHTHTRNTTNRSTTVCHRCSINKQEKVPFTHMTVMIRCSSEIFCKQWLNN